MRSRIAGGAFELQRFGGVFHFGGEFLLHARGLAREERLGLGDELAVIAFSDAGRRKGPSSA